MYQWLQNLIENSSEFIQGLGIALLSLLSEDLALVSFLAGAEIGTFPFIVGFVGYLVGVMVGDFLVYALGFALRFKKFKFLNPLRDKLDRYILKFNTSTDSFIFQTLIFTRFIPGSRFICYVYAGFKAFSLLSYMLMLFFLTLFQVGFMVLLKEPLKSILGIKHPWLEAVLAIGISFVIVRFFMRFIEPVLKKEIGLRSWVRIQIAHMKRLKKIEFWPESLFYIGVPFILIYLTFKYRSLRAPLVSNPGLEFSGLIGESKKQVNSLLENNPEIPFLKSFYIESSQVEQAKITQDFLSQKVKDLQLDYPLVVKPDKGLKAFGVEVAENLEELSAACGRAYSVVVQEFDDSPLEYGLFYQLDADRSKGQLISITKKEKPYLVGDGKASVENLVLKNKRHSYFAKSFWKQNKKEWKRVLNKGESFQLTTLGSHTQGCTFLDQSNLSTLVLEKKLFSICSQVQGFYIGRLDVKTESEFAFQKGEIKIIELNGAGGERTEIFDPSKKFKQIYKSIYQRLDRIYYLGKMNQKFGHTASVFGFFRAIMRQRKEQRLFL